MQKERVEKLLKRAKLVDDQKAVELYSEILDTYTPQKEQVCFVATTKRKKTTQKRKN